MNKEIEISPRQIAQAITDLLDEKEKLEQQNKELHNKIDKAIEYIEENTQELEGITGYYYTIYDTEDLLEILKDSDVDE